jgi:hypothetical protein
VSCTGESSKIYEIDVSTHVNCNSHCIQPLSSAPHDVELRNFSPVYAEVTLRSECVGQGPLTYGAGSWKQDIRLSPPRRWKRVAPAKFTENLRHDGTQSPQGGKQEVRVVVTTNPASELSQLETYADIPLYVNC